MESSNYLLIERSALADNMPQFVSTTLMKRLMQQPLSQTHSMKRVIWIERLHHHHPTIRQHHQLLPILLKYFVLLLVP
jgi:hypothetical protein